VTSKDSVFLALGQQQREFDSPNGIDSRACQRRHWLFPPIHCCSIKTEVFTPFAAKAFSKLPERRRCDGEQQILPVKLGLEIEDEVIAEMVDSELLVGSLSASFARAKGSGMELFHRHSPPQARGGLPLSNGGGGETDWLRVTTWPQGHRTRPLSTEEFKPRTPFISGANFIGHLG